MRNNNNNNNCNDAILPVATKDLPISPRFSPSSFYRDASSAPNTSSTHCSTFLTHALRLSATESINNTTVEEIIRRIELTNPHSRFYHHARKREAHMNWSIVTCKMAAPVTANYLEVYWPCAGGLSAVNAIGTQLRDPIYSGLTRWRMAV